MRNVLLLFLVLICQKIYSKEKIYMLLNCVEKETKRKIELVNLKIYNNDKEVDYKLMEDGVLVLNYKKLKRLKIQFSDNIIDFGKLNKLNDK
ncbi:hypothetical protein [Aureivirga sp. CE67]|uniref:hypothetical protein n=1 Tax=Aureivirga sp. CE67 TaxID=1788983 RepID=UPI0018CBC2C0|nr:hypothetical protein [Aureivirga sp. CE67]